MKTALITTTINVPTVLALYRKLDPSVKFYVAADEKTPLEAYEFCAGIPDCEIYSPERQRELGYECSELLGWNNDSRRNIALLEALKDGADVIVSIDDDMIPTPNSGTLCDFTGALLHPFDGLCFGTYREWVDAGQFTVPPAPQRGLPAEMDRHDQLRYGVMEVPIGVAQGIILGVPDTGAITALTHAPFVHSASDILRNGFVVDPCAHTVFNSQFTAFRRELAPAFAQFYNHQGRNTDIFASMLMRRLMRNRDLYTYFGPPSAFHARTPRPLFKDLKAEMFGLEHIEDFAEYLDRVQLPNESPIEDCRIMFEGFAGFTDENKLVAGTWYNDVGKVL